MGGELKPMCRLCNPPQRQGTKDSSAESKETLPGLRPLKTLCRVTSMGKQERSVRMSLQTLRTLEAFLESPSDELSGSDVQKSSGLASGTLYPILLQLESAGWFVSRWEAVDPASVGRPRRRLYRLT